MNRIFAVMLVLACHKEVKTDLVSDQAEHAAVTKDTAATKDETKSQDATDIDTKTTRQENAIVVQAPDGSVTVAKIVATKPLQLPKGSKVIGTVALAATTVEQDKHVGAKLDVTASAKNQTVTGTDDKATKLKTATTTTTDTGPGWKFYLTVIFVIVLAIAGGLVILKFKLWRPL